MSPKELKLWGCNLSYFSNQTPWLLFISLLILCRHYLRAAARWGRHLFLWKAWRHRWRLDRYERVRRWWLLDPVSSMRSLSLPLSAMGMTCTTQTVLALAWWLLSEIICTRVCVPRLVAAVTIQGQHLFRSELRIVRLLFEGGHYLRAVSIRRNTVLVGRFP